jgi:glycosyltransferase involved in cell wall biosynthesis
MVIASTIAAPVSEANSKHAPQARRVLHVLAASTGGIRRHVHYLALNPPAGFRTAAVMGPPTLEGYFEGVDFRAWEGRRPWRPVEPDVIHAHGVTAGVRVVRSTSLSRSRPAVVVTVHTSAQQTLRADLPGVGFAVVQRALWGVARKVVRRADAVIAVSEEVKQHFGATDVVAPAIELSGPVEPRNAVRSKLGAGEESIVVLAVGRLHRDKALDVFIDAVKASGARGWIAGEGPDRPRLEKLAEGSGVALLGQRDDIPSLLAASDAFALPTTAESYGLAVLEAIHAGLPVVATRTGAIEEIAGDAGLLVPAGNRAAFVDAVGRIVHNGELRERLTKAARNRTLPSAEELASRIGMIYERVIAGRQR